MDPEKIGRYEILRPLAQGFAVCSCLEMAEPSIGAQATSLRAGGLVVVAACFVALALALNALRAPRATAPRPSPSAAA